MRFLFFLGIIACRKALKWLGYLGLIVIAWFTTSRCFADNILHESRVFSHIWEPLCEEDEFSGLRILEIDDKLGVFAPLFMRVSKLFTINLAKVSIVSILTYAAASIYLDPDFVLSSSEGFAVSLSLLVVGVSPIFWLYGGKRSASASHALGVVLTLVILMVIAISLVAVNKAIKMSPIQSVVNAVHHEEEVWKTRRQRKAKRASRRGDLSEVGIQDVHRLVAVDEDESTGNNEGV